jgi:hypothetical protein
MPTSTVAKKEMEARREARKAAILASHYKHKLLKAKEASAHLLSLIAEPTSTALDASDNADQ